MPAVYNISVSITRSPTWSSVSLLHPDVAVALCHARLRVQEWHSNAPLGAEPGVVVVTLLKGISVALLPQPNQTEPYGELGLQWPREKKLQVTAFLNYKQFNTRLIKTPSCVCFSINIYVVYLIIITKADTKYNSQSYCI